MEDFDSKILQSFYGERPLVTFAISAILDIVKPTIRLMPDQAQKTRPVVPGSGGGGEGPASPKVEKPNTEELLKRMRKVDPDQAKRYRQRTGQ